MGRPSGWVVISLGPGTARVSEFDSVGHAVAVRIEGSQVGTPERLLAVGSDQRLDIETKGIARGAGSRCVAEVAVGADGGVVRNLAGAKESRLGIGVR